MIRTIVVAILATCTSLALADDLMTRRTMSTPTPSALQLVKLVYAEATGSFLVLLAIAQQQRLLEKHGLEVHAIAARGATVPTLTNDVPIGFIGEPAAILQAAGGNDVRIVASFSRTSLSGHLVGRPDVRGPSDLRGRRLGVRVLGAGLWISTVLALEQLGLSPARDRIALVPVGSPGEILRALEDGTIDAALLPVVQSRRLSALGYHVLLDNYPEGITAYGGALVVSAAYLDARPEIVEKLIAALMEALALSLAGQTSDPVMDAFKESLGIADKATALANLRELLPKPYPSRAALESMQRVMSQHDARVLDLKLDQLMDDRIVQRLGKAEPPDKTVE
jgi:ABC-type nitrate/sulfonate/bicarbonate transport system substrate-binding protein